MQRLSADLCEMTNDDLPLDLTDDRAMTPPRQRLLSPDEEEQVVALYLAGSTAEDVTAQFGIHRLTVSRAVRRAGGRVSREPLTQHEVDRATALYSSGLSLADVATKLSLPRESIRRQLIQAGVNMRTKGGATKQSRR